MTELIDVNENVVNVYRYTPFGEALVREETVYNPYQFTGRQYDAESGLHHYRARAYSADIGRFMQQDPAGMVDGPNLYAYCGNEPVGRRDPGGDVSYPGNLNRYPSILFDGSYADRPQYTYGMYHNPHPNLFGNKIAIDEAYTYTGPTGMGSYTFKFSEYTFPMTFPLTYFNVYQVKWDDIGYPFRCKYRMIPCSYVLQLLGYDCEKDVERIPWEAGTTTFCEQIWSQRHEIQSISGGWN